MKNILLNSFTCFAVIWTIIEAILTLLIPENTFDLFTRRWLFIILLGIISLFYGIYKSYPSRRITLNLGSRKTPIEIKFGDLFKQEGIKAIPASQFFESEIEKYISSKSLQAQLILQKYQGNRSTYREDIVKLLENHPYVEVKRGRGKEKKYKVGTTAILKFGSEIFLHFAISETEIKSLESNENANIIILQEALSKLWKKAKAVANGDIINIPLIGDGITGIGLPPEKILELNLIAILNELQGNHNVQKIRILLHKESNFHLIDLNKIFENWKA